MGLNLFLSLNIFPFVLNSFVVPPPPPLCFFRVVAGFSVSAWNHFLYYIQQQQQQLRSGTNIHHFELADGTKVCGKTFSAADFEVAPKGLDRILQRS